jgi:ribonuclease HII
MSVNGALARTIPSFAIERDLMARGIAPIAGIDEVGRGPIAGPVAVAAVVLDPRDIPDGIDDSKALSAAAREWLYAEIMARALAVSVTLATATEIDATNIRRATLAAMGRAVRGLAVLPRHVLIDGREVPQGLGCEASAVVRGDAISQSIAAASIVAKVIRDRLMTRVAEAYPAYGFDSHKGYGTKLHLQRLEAHGPCPFHRMSFAPLARGPQLQEIDPEEDC